MKRLLNCILWVIMVILNVSLILSLFHEGKYIEEIVGLLGLVGFILFIKIFIFDYSDTYE